MPKHKYNIISTDIDQEGELKLYSLAKCWIKNKFKKKFFKLFVSNGWLLILISYLNFKKYFKISINKNNIKKNKWSGYNLLNLLIVNCEKSLKFFRVSWNYKQLQNH